MTQATFASGAYSAIRDSFVGYTPAVTEVTGLYEAIWGIFSVVVGTLSFAHNTLIGRVEEFSMYNPVLSQDLIEAGGMLIIVGATKAIAAPLSFYAAFRLGVYAASR